MKPFTVITDPGIDDLLALVLLAKLLPGKHSAVSSFGNVAEHVTGANTREILRLLGNWEYSSGSKLPLNGKLEHPWADYFHGPDGVWNVHSDPIQEGYPIIHLDAYPENPNLISLAPLTDLSKLFRSFELQSVTIMGGAFSISGNETPFAETNIAFDPEAAAHFFSSCKGIKVRVVPLDVTRQVVWSLSMVESIPESNGVNCWIKKVLLAWFHNYNHEKETNFNLHDPTAVFLTFFPNSADWQLSGVKIIEKGDQRGRTKLDRSAPPCLVATGIKKDEDIASMIFTLLFSSSDPLTYH